MPKSYNRGGEMRTIACGCGWTCRKSLKEANASYNRHIRFCEIERSEAEKKECRASIPTKGDKVQQKENGWKGIVGNLTATGSKMTALKTYDERTGEMNIYNITAPIRFHSADTLVQRRIVEIMVETDRMDAFNSCEIAEDECDALILLISLL